jgi:peptide-methionine (R)-S-oxide reductase
MLRRLLSLKASQLATCMLLFSCLSSVQADDKETETIRARLQSAPPIKRVRLTNEEWEKLLSPAQFQVLRGAATEPPFTNEYANNHERGIYLCGACGSELFSSQTKFDSGTGWPSFFAPLAQDRVALVSDTSGGLKREEVRCARCGSHLGHLFKDGPPPTHQRYCLNSLALKLKRRD